MKKQNKIHLDDCDKEILRQMINEFAAKHGHEVVRDLYHLNRNIRNTLDISRFPISLLYHLSLDILLETEYTTLTQKQIADKEGLTKASIHYIQRNHYEHKRKKKT